MFGDLLKLVIYDLLYYGKTSAAETSNFKELKHNKDLVPAFNNKLNDIIEYFDRYHKISYDIQGIRDKGIDVLVKYDYEYNNNLIGIQIKSFDDLEEKEWTTKLKAQITDVISHYGSKNLVDFYIAFCTDISKHKDKIRNATADLAGIKNINLHILSPEQSLYFIQLADFQIGSYLKKKLSEDDPIVTEAKESLEGLTLAQSAMVIDAASYFIQNGNVEFKYKVVTESTFVSEVYDKFPNIPINMLEADDKKLKKIFGVHYEINEIEDFQLLNDKGIFDSNAYSDSYKFDHGSYISLIAILYESIARYRYDDDESKWYVFYLLKEFEITIANKVKNKELVK